MIKRELPAERHYILPVCNMSCLDSDSDSDILFKINM